MSPPGEDPTSDGFGARRFLPLLLFLGSGCAALIYEIVWFQLLQLVIGSSAVSLAVLLGTFMGGMCLGSVGLARLVSPRRHPLHVYAMLELGTGILGIVALFLVPGFGRFYAVSFGHGLPGILLRGAVCAVCLLPPTALMGATLPAIARWVEPTPQGVSWLGFCYGANIAGAVLGCLLAGFYLLRLHDMVTATYVAAAINGAAALFAFGLAVLAPFGTPIDTPASAGGAVTAPGTRWVCLTIAVSGASALGAEVIWTRLLSLMLGPTVYTFSIILAVFLAGLGIGSGVGSALARRAARPWLLLGGCQFLLVAAITWAGWIIARSLPYWPIDPTFSRSPWLNFQLDLVRCLWAILPATCLWGASFPLALAAATSRGQDPGRLVGRVYAANTVGAIIGAIGFSLLLIPQVGTQQAQRLLVGLSAAAALSAVAPHLGSWWSRASLEGGLRERSQRLVGVVVLSAALGGSALAVWSMPKVPWGLIAFGRFLPTKSGGAKLLYVGEGMNASVAVTELNSGVRNFHISGKVEASSEAQDMRLQRMLGHLPALLHPKPRSALVVGCGAGVTAGSLVVHPEIEKIVICEIEPLIPQVVAQYFGKENHDVTTNARVRLVYDDARHYILTTPDKFDIITSDPIHPWVKGAATLYTKEYFELVKRHLTPGGLVTQWVPLYESNLAVVKSEIATFFDVFPHGTIWSNDVDGDGYDLVLLGQAEPMPIDVDALHERLQRDARVAQSLQEVGIRSMVSLLATYAGQAPDLGPWLEHAEINRDRNLRLQYLAGMGLNLDQGGLIYDDLLIYRKFPERLFVGSNERTQMLRLVIERPKSNK